MKTTEGWPVIGLEALREEHPGHQYALVPEAQVLGADGRTKTITYPVDGREDGVAAPIDCLTCGDRLYVFTPFAMLPAWALTRGS